jgi:VanZ family protein
MFEKPPRESEWLSWLFVSLWTLIIYLTIPLARAIQAMIVDIWGRQSFTYIVLACIVLAGVAATLYLKRRKTTYWSNWFWLILVALVFTRYTYQLSQAPEEALHFVEYGILGLLLYRALSHRIRDFSIYICAALIGAIIGTLDEVIQWAVPQRYWAYRDIWINLVAVVLTQIGIAGGMKPAIISGLPKPGNLRLLARLSMALLLLLTVTVVNTPDRIVWYANLIPGLGFLSQNESTMSEYGFLYHDADIGTFRSRFAPSELQRQDREHAKQAATILDRYRARRKYPEFLQTYTVYKDPFVHEARVHLFRRDRYLSRAEKESEDDELRRAHLDVAYREHLIMAKYFPLTLEQSAYALTPEKLELLASQRTPEQIYDSPVSSHLITLFSQGQLVFLLLLGILALILLDRFLTRKMDARSKNDRV